jgi:hypothetical protein
VITGLTIYAAELGPPLQVYVLAPIPVRLVLCPEQIMVLDGAMLTVGVLFTIRLYKVPAVQPLTAVPTMAKSELIKGLTTKVSVVGPLLQVYVLAPLPVKVADCPVHITLLLDVINTVGDAITDMDCTAELVQAFAAVATTV